MNQDLLTLEPLSLWKNFVKLTNIPRPSKHEHLVIDFLKDFALNNNLKYFVDKVGNVIIKKDATLGYENCKGVILQGHIDMVPQKNSDKVHNFEKDPIETYIDEGWVKARGTTLGADNGIGVAAILSVLESTFINHGPLEALFTVNEETGLTGAFGLDEKSLTGEILLNLDSEEEGEICIGCAGGTNANIEFNYTEQKVNEGSIAYKIFISGLKGGHSGTEISLDRCNAIRLLFNFLFNITKTTNIQISEICGGSLMNAIPREAYTNIVLSINDKNNFLEIFDKYQNEYTIKFKNTEPNFSFTISEIDIPEYVVDSVTQNNLIKSMYIVPNGVIKMSESIKDLVETSSNIGIIKTNNKSITVGALIRSSVDVEKNNIEDLFNCIFTLGGAKTLFDGKYSGWAPNINSPILKILESVYNNKCGKFPEVKAIHAGLECGVIGGIYPNLDMVSFGPTIKFAHSPDEKVEIKAVENFWNYLLDILKNIPLK